MQRLGELGTSVASFTYLSSYEGMGRAALGCAGTCRCDGATLDAHRGPEREAAGGERYVSLWESHDAVVRPLWPPRGKECLLRVTLLNETSSGGTKFKLGKVTLAGSRSASG